MLKFDSTINCICFISCIFVQCKFDTTIEISNTELLTIQIQLLIYASLIKAILFNRHDENVYFLY